MTFSPSTGLITSEDEAASRIAAMAAEAKPFGFDIETGYEGESRQKASLHPEENFVVGISVSNALTWARYLPLHHDAGTNLDNRAVAELFWDLFQVTDEEGLPLGVAHGAIFELRCMARWFLRWLWDHPRLGPAVIAARGYFPVRSCTLLESFAEGENQRHGLKDITWLNFGYRMTELLDLFPEGLTKREQESIRFSVLDQHDPKVISYACEDAIFALAHHLHRFPRVRDSLIYKVEMAVLPVVAGMGDEGVVYDWNFLRDASRKCHEFADRYQAEVLGDFAQLTGSPVAINLNSSQQLGKLLYEDCGMPVRRWTKGGKSGKRKPSVDAKVALKGLAAQFAPVAKLLKWKGLNTLCDNFLDKYERDFSYAPDGRAHPGLMQHGTITGRFSAETPNYQQSPKKYKVTLASGETFELNFRDSIRSPLAGTKPWWAWLLEEFGYVYPDVDPALGWYILGFDYSQIELRVFAGEANETALIEAFANGQDVHRLTAALMLGKALEDVTDEDRGVGKTMNFALAYGMTEEGLADRLGITVAEAGELFTQYHAAYPAMRTWTEQTISRARREGYVTTRFGRKVRIWEFESSERYIRRGGERTAGNAPIQGAATGDYVKIAMVRAHKALQAAGLDDRVRLAMNVHDALEWYVRKDVAPADVIAVLKDAVVFPVEGWPPMVAEWHLGERWGSVQDIELTLDGDVRLKGGQAERPVAADPAEGEEDELESVSVSAFRQPVAQVPRLLETMGSFVDKPVTVAGDGHNGAGGAPDSGDGGPAVAHPVGAAGQERGDVSPGGVDPGGAAAAGGRPARKVVVQVTVAPSAEQAQHLVALLRTLPGANSVEVLTPEGAVPVAGQSGLTPAHEAQVSVIFGGAIVHYDLDSVDFAALGQDLDL